MPVCPAHAAKWRGDEPFVSNMFVEASYDNNNWTISLKSEWFINWMQYIWIGHMKTSTDLWPLSAAWWSGVYPLLSWTLAPGPRRRLRKKKTKISIIPKHVAYKSFDHYYNWRVIKWMFREIVDEISLIAHDTKHAPFYRVSWQFRLMLIFQCRTKIVYLSKEKCEFFKLTPSAQSRKQRANQSRFP